MKYRVEFTDNFLKETKRLTKKYRSLKEELIKLIEDLEENPTIGTRLGNDIYKIRLSIASKNKGKSGGARILSYFIGADEKVILFSIYNKGEIDNISEQEMIAIINNHLNR